MGKESRQETIYDYKKMLKGITDLTEEAGYRLLDMVDAMDLDDRDSKDWKRRWTAFLMRFPSWKTKSKMKKPGGNLFAATVCLHRRFGTSIPSIRYVRTVEMAV